MKPKQQEKFQLQNIKSYSKKFLERVKRCSCLSNKTSYKKCVINCLNLRTLFSHSVISFGNYYRFITAFQTSKHPLNPFCKSDLSTKYFASYMYLTQWTEGFGGIFLQFRKKLYAYLFLSFYYQAWYGQVTNPRLWRCIISRLDTAATQHRVVWRSVILVKGDTLIDVGWSSDRTLENLCLFPRVCWL